MAQISSIGPLPDANPLIQSGAANKSASVSNTAHKTASGASPSAGALADEALSSPLQSQITRFSNVLSGLQKTAALTRAQYVQTYNKIKSGSYKVDSTDISKSIVSEMFSKQ